MLFTCCAFYVHSHQEQAPPRQARAPLQPGLGAALSCGELTEA